MEMQKKLREVRTCAVEGGRRQKRNGKSVSGSPRLRKRKGPKAIKNAIRQIVPHLSGEKQGKRGERDCDLGKVARKKGQKKEVRKGGGTVCINLCQASRKT